MGSSLIGQEISTAERRYGTEAYLASVDLVERMELEAKVSQLLLGEQPSPSAHARADWRQLLATSHPEKLVIDAPLVRRFDYLAALKGAGFVELDVPNDLVDRIKRNNEIFECDVRPRRDEFDFSSGAYVMSRKRLIERFANRYYLVGPLSISEYSEYDLREALNG